MTRRGILCVVFSVVIVGHASGQQPSSRLSNVVYVVHDTISRVTCSFKGEVTYVLIQNADTLVIRCLGMKADKRLLDMNRTNEAGLIRSVAVRMRPDKMLDIVVGLRHLAPFRVKREESSNSLALEVFGRGPVAASTAAMPKHETMPQKKEVARQERKQHPGETSSMTAYQSVVDVAAIVRSQVESEKGSVSSWAEAPRKNAGKQPLTAGLLLAAVIVLPLVSGVGILALMYHRRRTRRRAAAPPVHISGVEPQAPEPIEVSMHESPGVAAPVAEEPALQVAEAIAGQSSREEEQSFQIAQSMIQGNEQYALARRFAAESSEVTQRRIRKACATKTARTHRVRVAKRLGVGKGEVELAIKLRDMARRRSGKEKKS